MLKTLIKKQFLEINVGYFMNRKTGKMRSKVGILLYVLLFLFLFGLIGLASYALASTLCKAFSAANLGWFYFSLMGLLSVALSVFGGVFNTYTGLYIAKDNELLLSMPIRPSDILLARMSGVYLICLLYETIVYIPTLIAWFIYGKTTLTGVVYSVLLMLILSFISLVLSCILGFFVAQIAIRVKKKSFMTVLASLVFIIGYYYIYFNMTDFLKKIMTVGEQAAKKLKTYAYISYMFGQAATGDTVNMLIFTAITAVLTYLTYLVLSKSFLKILTYKKGDSAAKKAVTASEFKVQNIKSALLKREFKRFSSSPIYMLNCGIGILFSVVAIVVLIVKSGDIGTVLSVLKEFGVNTSGVSVFATAVVCLLASTCYFTAPSISLEGSNLWILKTVPASITDIFAAKQKMHIILAGIPAVLLSLTMSIILKTDFTILLFSVFISFVYVQLVSAAGLLLNLKMPNLSWTNESVPVKQSAPVTIVLFGGWALSIAMAGIYFLLRSKIQADTYLIAVFVILVLAVRFVNRYINSEGVKLFKNL